MKNKGSLIQYWACLIQFKICLFHNFLYFVLLRKKTINLEIIWIMVLGLLSFIITLQ